MAYRRAHWAILFLAPFILLAFWSQYFGRLGTAPFAFHAHGLTASAWIVLVGLQSWAIAGGHRALHRMAGKAVFIAVPCFAAAAVLVISSMAGKYLAGYPFYGQLGPRLGLHDTITTVALVGLVCTALVERRRAVRHGGYMVATVVLVLPPVIARLPLGVDLAWHVAEVIPMLIALGVWRVASPNGRPWLIVAVVMMLQIVQSETVGQSARWTQMFAAFGTISPWPTAVLAALISLLALLFAWRRGDPAQRARAAMSDRLPV